MAHGGKKLNSHLRLKNTKEKESTKWLCWSPGKQCEGHIVVQSGETQIAVTASLPAFLAALANPQHPEQLQE